jgi:tetratricopeptide (TPR) repeat protein
MIRSDETDTNTTDSLAAHGYWPAIAAQFLAEKKYSRVIELFKEHTTSGTPPLSARLLYARALFHTSQHEAAAEQFRQVLTHDPENLVALKYLGDIRFASNDTFTALALYERVLELDPKTSGVQSEVKATKPDTTRIITMQRPAEPPMVLSRPPAGRVVFYTETIGDLYMAQGYYALAATVYRTLIQNGNGRVQEKLAIVEEKMKERDTYVSSTH